MTNYNLDGFRDYQVPPIVKGIEFFASKEKLKPAILVLPTAGGKSYIVAGIARNSEGITLAIQPSKELLEQNYEKYQLIGGDDASIFSASAGTKNLSGRVIFTTIGTLVNAIEKNPMFFAGVRNIIVDECHLFPPKSDSMFSKVISACKKAKLLGLTASPWRLQNTLEGSRIVLLTQTRPRIFSSFLHITNVHEIAPKFWTPLVYEVKQFDGSHLVLQSNGDEFTEHSVKLWSQNNLMNIVNAALDERFESAMIFVRSVDVCKQLVKIVPSSAYVCADTPKHERTQLIKDFKSGKIKRMFNVNVLGVGFDFPELQHLILAYPTLSLARYYQWVGRITRIAHGKKTATVTDLAGLVSRFGKVEDLIIEKRDNDKYQVYSGDKQLSMVLLGAGSKQAFTPQVANSDTFEDMVLDFGAHRGKKISEVPKNYLEWALREMKYRKKLVANIAYFLQIDDKK